MKTIFVNTPDFANAKVRGITTFFDYFIMQRSKLCVNSPNSNYRKIYEIVVSSLTMIRYELFPTKPKKESLFTIK